MKNIISLVAAISILYSVVVFASTGNTIECTVRSEYNPGQEVVVSGKVHDSENNQAKGTAVAIEVRDPNNSPVFIGQAETNNGGSFEFLYKIKPNASLGQYNLVLNAVGVSKSLNFNVKQATHSSGGSGGGNSGSGTTAAPSNTSSIETDTQGGNTVIGITSQLKSDSTGAASLSAQQISDILENINEVARQAQALQNGEEAESRLVITVSASENTQKFSVNIPVNIVEAANTNNIDKIEISTPVAAIVVPPSVISNTQADSVVIRANIVDNETLSAEQRAAAGDNIVYDFSINAIKGNESTSISNFASDVKITIPYMLKETDDPNSITVYFINDKGELENMQGVYDPATKTVGFETDHFSKYIVKANKVTYNDIDKYTWAKVQIESMAAKGIIDGKAKGYYNPEDNITRAEFTKLLVKVFKIKESNEDLMFDDVKAGEWYYSAVSAAVRAGVIKGKTDKMFAPNESITRQDMAVMIARALEKFNGKTISDDIVKYIDFTDKDEISNYAKESVALAVKNNILKGSSNKLFKPTDNLTRAESAVAVYNLFYLR